MTSRALMGREMSLYFCVKSIVAWRSFSEIPFSKTGNPILPAKSGFKPAHFTMAARLPSGSA